MVAWGVFGRPLHVCLVFTQGYLQVYIIGRNHRIKLHSTYDFSHCYDQISNKTTKEEQDFIFAHGFRGFGSLCESLLIQSES